MPKCLFHFPVHLFPRMKLLVARLVLREPQRLFGAERQNTEHRQTLVKQCVDVVLKLAIEINQDVPTEDDVEFRERSIGDEIVLRKDDIASESGAKKRPVVLGRVVLRERLLATRADVVL